jgi:hypothetical protein
VDKIIVDTSVWIDFFKGQLQDPVRTNFICALDNRDVVVTQIIFHEILMGTKNKKQYNEIEEMFSAVTKLSLPPEKLSDFNQFAWKTHRLGLAGKFTDVHIAYLSLLHQYPVLSFDRYFHKLARQKLIQVITFE